MKAIHVTKYGTPDVLQIREVEKPMPKEGAVQIRIVSTVAALPDCAFRLGQPALARLFTGLSRPKKIPGDVFSGVIEMVGKSVKAFKPGERVYGTSGDVFGTNAEFIVLPESAAITRIARGS